MSPFHEIQSALLEEVVRAPRVDVRDGRQPFELRLDGIDESVTGLGRSAAHDQNDVANPTEALPELLHVLHALVRRRQELGKIRIELQSGGSERRHRGDDGRYDQRTKAVAKAQNAHASEGALEDERDRRPPCLTVA